MKRIPHITGHLWSRVCIHPLCFSFGEWGMERWREQDRDKSRHDAIELVQLDELKRWRRRRRSRTSHQHHSFIIHNTVSKQSQACSWTDDLDFTFTESFFFLLLWCEYSLYVATYHRRNNGLCNTVVRITHSAGELEAPGRILTFIVWGKVGVCRGKQKLVLTGIRQKGVEWGKKREDRKGGGGGLCQIQDKVRGTKEVWAEECWREVN